MIPLQIPVIGLTGGIGSGKSSVARFFSEEGFPTIDADQIARELSLPGGRAAPALLSRFGTTDRKILREKIFSDPQAKTDLEKILHPLIVEESQKRIKEIHEYPLTPKAIIYEASLLVETGRNKDFPVLIVVHATKEKRIQRLVERDKMTPELAQKIIQGQTSDHNRIAAATHVIHNSGTLDDLKAKVKEMIVSLGMA